MKGVIKIANLNIRVDDTLKKQAETIFTELGISLSAATTIFLKQVVRCNDIPFELRVDPFYSAENEACFLGRLFMRRLLILANARQKTLKRVNQLLQDIDCNGYSGIGKPEALKGNFQGYWSHCIDETNRLIYRIAENRVEILQCCSHYDDK